MAKQLRGNNMSRMNGAIVQIINNEINSQLAILSSPTSISSLEDYKYYVGVIRGLETALEIFNQHLIEVDKND